MAIRLSIGDPMPRITLPTVSGAMFDSWNPAEAGQARVYWLGATIAAPAAAQLAEALAASETLLQVVASGTAAPDRDPGWAIDPTNGLRQAFGVSGPLAVIVDAWGRVAALVPAPSAENVTAAAAALHAATPTAMIRTQAPVLFIERVLDPELCLKLIEMWQRGAKLTNEVAAASGANIANADVKRRQDVSLNEGPLFLQLRDCLGRRVMPAIFQAFHIRIGVIETPRIGCYDSSQGGWFRRHRDNISAANAHRQFAVSLNLNGDDEYDGGELRFPEFGRQIYRPAAGGALVFSTSLLHEVVPVTRGRRFGVFTFLSATGPVGGRA